MYFVSCIVPVLKFVFGMKYGRELFMVVDPEPILLVLKASWVVSESVTWLVLIPPIFHYQKHLQEILLENVAIALMLFIPFFNYMGFRVKDFNLLYDALLRMIQSNKSTLPRGTIAQIDSESDAMGPNNVTETADNDEEDNNDEDDDDDDGDDSFGGLRSAMRAVYRNTATENREVDDNGQPIPRAVPINRRVLEEEDDGMLTPELYDKMKNKLFLVTKWMRQHITFLEAKYPLQPVVKSAIEIALAKSMAREKRLARREAKERGIINNNNA